MDIQKRKKKTGFQCAVKKYKNATNQSKQNQLYPSNQGKSYPSSNLPYQLSNTSDYPHQTNINIPKSPDTFYQQQQLSQISSQNSKINFDKEISSLKSEITSIKQQTIKTKEKISIFIKLVRNYAKKFLSLSKMLYNESPSQTALHTNIINTINQFYNMIYNPKLNESIFELSGFLIDENIGISPGNSTNTSYVTDNIEFIKHFEENIKKLNEENIKLNKDKIDYCSTIDRIENEKKKLLNDINSKNEKINSLEKINETLQTEIKRKDNIINYLENKQMQNQLGNENDTINNNSNNKIHEHIDNNKINLNSSNNEEIRLTNENIPKDNINNSNIEEEGSINKENDDNSPIKDNIITNKYSHNKKNNRNHNKDNNLKEISYSQRPQKIKQEIDILDQEIIELRQQLQSIITKK